MDIKTFQSLNTAYVVMNNAIKAKEEIKDFIYHERKYYDPKVFKFLPAVLQDTPFSEALLDLLSEVESRCKRKIERL